MEAQKALLDFILIHADNSLIISQRLSEWCGHGPVLEQDMAMTNIALDYIGRSRLLYQYAAEISADGRTEDDFAFMRVELDYKNCLLAEYPNTDFAFTVARQFFLDTFYLDFLEGLVQSSDERISHIAAKAIKETAYHYKWSSDWVIRLGDGTELSHEKMQNAVNQLWRYKDEMFEPVESEKQMIRDLVSPNLENIKSLWHDKVQQVFSEACLMKPDEGWGQKGGKIGYHTEHMGYLLADLQYMQRAYPGLDW